MALTLKQALTMFWEQIQVRFVKRENGKGLSTNDFTNEYKEKLDELENITFEESDPTVPAWAKAATKPTYTASEVGADPSGSATEALADAKSYVDSALQEIPSPDWNAAEGEPGHVLNRTHYVDGVRSEVLIPEISAVLDDQGVPIEGLIQPFPSDGDVFTVMYNGVAYKRNVIIQNLFEDGTSFVAMLGNPIVMGVGEDNGDPFTVVICDEAAYNLMGFGAILYALDNTNASTVTMSVSYEIENIHKLDKKYISEHSHKWSDINDTPFMTIYSDTLYCETGEKVNIGETVCTKVSNTVPTANDCAKGMQVLVRLQLGSTVHGEYPVSIDGSSIVFSQDGFAEIAISSYGSIIIIPQDNYSMDGTIIQRAGMYVCISDPYYRVYSITLPGSALFPRQILNPIYLPEDIGDDTVPDHTHKWSDIVSGTMPGHTHKWSDIVGAGAILPTVATSDNGAFLRVVSGTWKAVKLANAEDGEF